jgi:conjugative transfer signal peptidase TraF
MNRNKTLLLVLAIAVTTVLLCGLFFTMGGFINTSTTAPSGLYLKVDKPLAIGKTVVFCPPNKPEFQSARDQGIIDSGTCPDNFDTMVLNVAAKYKNKVTINDSGVYVNDVFYPNSKPLVKDKQGRNLPVLTLENYELKENEVLLMSDSTDDAFDGRYFGVINVEQIDSVVSPLI